MMPPAFSSTRQAAGFTFLLLLLLLAPVLTGPGLLPSRREAYSRQSWGTGPYPWIEEQIFEEKEPIDIAFVGSSHIFNAIDTPYVQARLSETLGRPAVVRTIAWGGAGFDGLFFIVRDLLAHRQVRMLVFYDENPTGEQRHSLTTAWFRFAEDAGLLTGLSFREKSLFYFAAIVGAPRNLLSLVRPNLPVDSLFAKNLHWERLDNAPNPATRLGSLSVGSGFSPREGVKYAPFEKFKPASFATPADALVYSSVNKGWFSISQDPIPAWQLHFTRELAKLFTTTKTVMLHLPVLAEARSPIMAQRTDWLRIFGSETKLMGVPSVKLFGQLSEEDVLKLFSDPFHFNRNGQEYFTPLITPRLIQMYEGKP